MFIDVLFAFQFFIKRQIQIVEKFTTFLHFSKIAFDGEALEKQ